MVFKRKKENKFGLMALIGETVKMAKHMVVLDKTESSVERALVGETAKMAKHMVVLDKTEASLERELERERTHIPTTPVGKFRKKGEHLLHSKHVLLMVVILNILDCMLVLGELMLDIKYVTDLLTTEYQNSDNFIAKMKGVYPDRLGYIVYDDIMTLRHELEIAHVTWEEHGKSHDQHHASSHDSSPPTISFSTAVPALTPNNATHMSLPAAKTTHHADTAPVRKRRGSGGGGGGGNTMYVGHDHQHSIEEDIAHGLHKASITILGILVVETMFKIFCLGKELLGHKLECFDGFIVCVSFVVDLVFLKGLQQFKVQQFVLILAFMVPWRVIRVVNSLVVAIMDHEHFRLKLLYKQKKKTTHELKEAQSEITGLNACITEFERLCSEAGISETYVQAKLTMFRKVKDKSNPMAALSGFAIGGEAMKKPFPNGNTHQLTDVVITLENAKSDTTKEKETDIDTDTCTPGAQEQNGNCLNKSLNGIVLDNARPRSVCSVESRTRTDSHTGSIVDLLAEQSAEFISTMNHSTHNIHRPELSGHLDSDIEDSVDNDVHRGLLDPTSNEDDNGNTDSM